MVLQTKLSNIADTVAELKGIPTRQELVEQLSQGIVEVTFNKMNGDQRTMLCTLKTELLPAATKDDTLSQARVRTVEDQVVVVWDTVTNGWRSFRYDRVTNVNSQGDINGLST